MLDSREWMFGRWTEIAWNSYVNECGWSVIATADYSGPRGDRAPMMHGENEVILPDFDTAKHGQRVFLECKFKDDWFEFRKTGRMQTGINVSNLSHYKKIQHVTGSPVILGMLNGKSGEMVANTLLGLGEERISPHDAYPIANWDVSKFRRIAEVDADRFSEILWRKDGSLRPPPDRYDAAYLRRMFRFLRPTQGELNLLHYDILARAGRIEE